MTKEERCSKCGKTILEATAKRTGRLCIYCYKLVKSSKTFIHLKCCGCGREYVVGEDAIVTTPESILEKIGGYLMTGDPSSISLYPDIVGSITGSSRSLSPDVIKREEERIKEIAKFIRIGGTRKWKCDKCYTVQDYPEDCCI